MGGGCGEGGRERKRERGGKERGKERGKEDEPSSLIFNPKIHTCDYKRITVSVWVAFLSVCIMLFWSETA